MHACERTRTWKSRLASDFEEQCVSGGGYANIVNLLNLISMSMKKFPCKYILTIGVMESKNMSQIVSNFVKMPLFTLQ